MLMESPDFIEIQITQQCLNKLPILLNITHLDFIRKIHYNVSDNFRAVKLAQLYFAKSIVADLIPILRETCFYNNRM